MMRILLLIVLCFSSMQLQAESPIFPSQEKIGIEYVTTNRLTKINSNKENAITLHGSLEMKGDEGTMKISDSTSNRRETSLSSVLFSCLLFLPLLIINFLYPKRKYKV